MRLSRIVKSLAGLATAILLSSCGGGGGGTLPPPITYAATSGVAQKGPLIKGSTVAAQELDAKLSPTGKQYSYQITSDLGTFSPTSTFGSQYIGLNATGYYFDEIANSVSTGPVTLNGYGDLTTNAILNVNLLTTLAYQRIQHLVTSSNMTFAAAATQAENEVLAALNIPAGSYGPFSTLDLSGSSDGDHILAAISSIFVYGNSAGPLNQLIDNFQADIGENGAITNAKTTAALVAAAEAINPAAVATNLTQKYASKGLTFTASNISDWIAQSGDGVIGKFAFQVSDSTPSTVFTLPAAVVNQFAGTPVSATAGELSVNGTPVSGPVSFNSGDVVTLSPGPGAFPNELLTSYLVSGSTKLARVSFISGLISIVVTPNAPSVPKGLTQQFKATGTFSDTSTADLTSSVSWTSGTPASATINGSSGLANALATGATTITATSGSVSGNTTLTVTPAVVQSISITPNPASSGVGVSQQLTATGTYSDGTTPNVTTTASWASSVTSVATVGPTTGVVTGISTGSATISASIGSVTATTPLSVVANTWVPTGSLLIGVGGQTVTSLANGTVLEAGGECTGAPPNFSCASAEIYDPAAGTWSLTGSMAAARIYDTATLLADGAVLVAGGASCVAAICNGATNFTELYNPAAGIWSSAGNMSVARQHHAATLLANGDVLVTGGDPTGEGIRQIWASAEFYDPIAGTWTPTASMSRAREFHTSTLLQSGKVLVAGGGYTGDTNAGYTPDSSAEIYDPVAGTWALTGSMSTSRRSPSATLLPSGKVLVAGGYSGGGVLASTELYDPVAASWTLTGNMSAARAGHSATLLPNGTVLVAGGGPTSAEIYDPVSGIWSPAGSLLAGGATTTLLPNGTVLAVGGLGSEAVAAEIYY